VYGQFWLAEAVVVVDWEYTGGSAKRAKVTAISIAMM
jgi:hypothetical protein